MEKIIVYKMIRYGGIALHVGMDRQPMTAQYKQHKICISEHTNMFYGSKTSLETVFIDLVTN